MWGQLVLEFVFTPQKYMASWVTIAYNRMLVVGTCLDVLSTCSIM